MDKFVYFIYQDIPEDWKSLNLTTICGKIGKGDDKRVKSYVTPYGSSFSVYKSEYTSEEKALAIESDVLTIVQRDGRSEIASLEVYPTDTMKDAINRYRSRCKEIIEVIKNVDELHHKDHQVHTSSGEELFIPLMYFDMKDLLEAMTWDTVLDPYILFGFRRMNTYLPCMNGYFIPEVSNPICMRLKRVKEGICPATYGSKVHIDGYMYIIRDGTYTFTVCSHGCTHKNYKGEYGLNDVSHWFKPTARGIVEYAYPKILSLYGIEIQDIPSNYEALPDYASTPIDNISLGWHMNVQEVRELVKEECLKIGIKLPSYYIGRDALIDILKDPKRGLEISKRYKTK